MTHDVEVRTCHGCDERQRGFYLSISEWVCEACGCIEDLGEWPGHAQLPEVTE